MLLFGRMLQAPASYCAAIHSLKRVSVGYLAGSILQTGPLNKEKDMFRLLQQRGLESHPVLS